MAVDPALMEARLRAYYAKFNPGNDQNIAEIVRKYAGKEQVLCAKLKKKYGVAPDLNLAVDEPASATASSTPGASSSSTIEKRQAVNVISVTYERDFQPFLIPPSTGGAFDSRSEDFDPLQALQRDRLPALAPAHPLDNILKCRHLLPASDPHYQSVVVHAKKSAPETQASSKPDTAKKDPTPTLFDRLADTYTDGPFTVLRRYFLERKRVVVVIRRVNSIRGACAGYLKAFDKHMNIVLMDVTETFVPHATHTKMLQDVRDGRLAAADTLFSVADARRNRGFTQQQYSKQLFIRGDNVVMVLEERPHRGVAGYPSRGPRP